MSSKATRSTRSSTRPRGTAAVGATRAAPPGAALDRPRALDLGSRGSARSWVDPRRSDRSSRALLGQPALDLDGGREVLVRVELVAQPRLIRQGQAPARRRPRSRPWPRPRAPPRVKTRRCSHTIRDPRRVPGRDQARDQLAHPQAIGPMVEEHPGLLPADQSRAAACRARDLHRLARQLAEHTARPACARRGRCGAARSARRCAGSRSHKQASMTPAPGHDRAPSSEHREIRVAIDHDARAADHPRHGSGAGVGPGRPELTAQGQAASIQALAISARSTGPSSVVNTRTPIGPRSARPRAKNRPLRSSTVTTSPGSASARARPDRRRERSTGARRSRSRSNGLFSPDGPAIWVRRHRRRQSGPRQLKTRADRSSFAPMSTARPVLFALGRSRGPADDRGASRRSAYHRRRRDHALGRGPHRQLPRDHHRRPGRPSAARSRHAGPLHLLLGRLRRVPQGPQGHAPARTC